MPTEPRLRHSLSEAARRIDVAPGHLAVITQRAQRRRTRRLAVSSLATVVLLVAVVFGISRAVVGGAGLEVAGQPDGTRDIAVFLCDGRECEAITDEERQQLLTALQDEPSVVDVVYESKLDAYNRFQEQFADQPDFTAGISPDDLPASFRVQVDLSGDAQAFADRYRTHAGVEDVTIIRDRP